MFLINLQEETRECRAVYTVNYFVKYYCILLNVLSK
jgi:hypothetical protein